MIYKLVTIISIFEIFKQIEIETEKQKLTIQHHSKSDRIEKTK